MPTDKRRVLITGASSGLGREMALQLAREGCRVAITGRRQGPLEGTARALEGAGGESLALLGDVTDLEQVKSQYARVREKWGGLDWAILNAGVSARMNAREFKAESYKTTFDANVIGVANWLEAVLPDMVRAGSGTVAGIASLAGFRGLPNSGAYSASKAALISMLESTRVDLRGTGVSVVTVCPGFVKSEMTDKNDPRDMKFMLETSDGAKRILDGIRRGDRVVHFPWQLSYFVMYVLHNMPGFLYDWFASRHVKRRRRSDS